MKLILLVFILASGYAGYSQNNSLGIFDDHSDIGNPKLPGSFEYDAATQQYHLKGGGYNIWFNRDEFQFAYKKLTGDFVLTANFEFVGEKGNGHRKIGWMLRPNKDDAAAGICAAVHGDGLTALQWRALRGAYMRDPEDELFFPKKNLHIIQLERMGKKIMMRVANAGEPLQLVGVHEMENLPDTVLAGLFICSHDSANYEEAKVWNVRIDRPVPDGYNPEKSGYIGCRLETINVFDGQRKIIRESAGRFEAPNWLPDGDHLLYNESGSMYTLGLKGGEPVKLNTGDLNHNNNDHGISFDGKWLAISHHRTGLPGGGSTVYVLPAGGGTPKQVTEKTPSYWHGWAPGAKEVLIVAQRDSKIYNLYKVNVATGVETPLTTNSSGHVDGPEFSPDGKYIYYNANASGTMQIWRMKPDGSGKEQLTFNETHNWFPHISPDGNWLAYISFPPDIDPDAHPSYKRVTLRLMPLNKPGTPRVIAYLYGGQGTLNAPSWSPDSKSIAFVSNSGK